METSVPPPPSTPRDPVLPSMPTELTVGRPNEKLLVQTPIDQTPLRMVRSGPNKGKVIPATLPGVQEDSNLNWDSLPGTGAGTTIIVGHARASSSEVFNPLTTINPATASGLGYQATLVTQKGVLMYDLMEVHLIGKSNVKHWDQLTTNEQDRLLLVTCDLEENQDTFNNRILVFKLSSSVSHG